MQKITVILCYLVLSDPHTLQINNWSAHKTLAEAELKLITLKEGTRFSIRRITDLNRVLKTLPKTKLDKIVWIVWNLNIPGLCLKKIHFFSVYVRFCVHMCTSIRVFVWHNASIFIVNIMIVDFVSPENQILVVIFGRICIGYVRPAINR